FRPRRRVRRRAGRGGGRMACHPAAALARAQTTAILRLPSGGKEEDSGSSTLERGGVSVGSGGQAGASSRRAEPGVVGWGTGGVCWSLLAARVPPCWTR